MKQIAQYFATKHGLKLVGNVSDLQKIEVEHKTQEKQTDLAFLSRLAREYGIVFPFVAINLCLWTPRNWSLSPW